MTTKQSRRHKLLATWPRMTGQVEHMGTVGIYPPPNFGRYINLFQGSSARFVLPAILGQTEGLAGNSKPIYEVCDSKSEKSAPMYCFEGTPLRYSVFAWIVGLTNLAQKTLIIG